MSCTSIRLKALFLLESVTKQYHNYIHHWPKIFFPLGSRYAPVPVSTGELGIQLGLVVSRTGCQSDWNGAYLLGSQFLWQLDV